MIHSTYPDLKTLVSLFNASQSKIREWQTPSLEAFGSPKAGIKIRYSGKNIADENHDNNIVIMQIRFNAGMHIYSIKIKLELKTHSKGMSKESLNGHGIGQWVAHNTVTRERQKFGVKSILARGIISAFRHLEFGTTDSSLFCNVITISKIAPRPNHG